MGLGWPRAGGMDNQDPLYLDDLQLIYKLRNIAYWELFEDKVLKAMENERKALLG